MDLKFKAFVMIMSILGFSVIAHADRLAQDGPAQSGNAVVTLEVGQCVLSVQCLYKRETRDRIMPIIPFDKAKLEDCMRRVFCTDEEITAAYQSLNEGDKIGGREAGVRGWR